MIFSRMISLQVTNFGRRWLAFVATMATILLILSSMLISCSSSSLDIDQTSHEHLFRRPIHQSSISTSSMQILPQHQDQRHRVQIRRASFLLNPNFNHNSNEHNLMTIIRDDDDNSFSRRSLIRDIRAWQHDDGPRSGIGGVHLPHLDMHLDQYEQQQHYIKRSSELPLAEALLMENSRSRNDEIETIFIRKGANGSLPCLPMSKADNMNKIEWFKEDRKLAEAEEKRLVVWNLKNSIAYLPDAGELYFRGVTNEDSGEYHCLLTRSKNQEPEDGVVRFYVQDVPDPPQMPIITGSTQGSITLSWVPGLDNHFSPIMHYVIHVREGVNGVWDTANRVMTPDNRTQFDIINLKPFTTYSFRVLAVNAIGVSEPSPESHYFITLRQKPDSRLHIVSARNLSANAIKLEWLPPDQKDIHGEFLGFRIKYVHQYLDNSLRPINLSSSISNTDEQQWWNQQQQYQQYQQHQQHQQHQLRKQHQIEQPSINGSLAKEIIVGDPAQTSYVVKNLNTFTLYKFSLQVMNPAGYGPATEVLAMTDEGASSPPQNVSITRTGDTWIKLRWSEPKFPNGILQGYQIIIHDLAKDSNQTRRLSDDGQMEANMEKTISQLNPLTWYSIHVQAFSRKYPGDLSPAIKFRTDVSAPSAPQQVNVTCESTDSILVRWIRPESIYDRLDFYYILYKSDLADDYMETSITAKKDNLLNEHHIYDLTPNMIYELKVMAATKSQQDPNLIYKSEQSPTLRVVLKPNCESV